MSQYPSEKSGYPGSGSVSPRNGDSSVLPPPSDPGYAQYPHSEPPLTDSDGKPVKPKKQSWLKRFAPGETPAQLLNPPPSCFERQCPRNLPYPPFPPMTLVGKTALSKGFLVNLPEASIPLNGPHPFVTHDIAEEDWARFIHDVKIAASLALKDRVRAALIPAPIGLLTGGIGAVIGFFLTMRIESHIKKGKVVPTAELIDAWNRYFFNPRRLHITLAKGDVVYSGPHDLPPPDMAMGMPSPIDPGDKHWRLVVSAI